MNISMFSFQQKHWSWILSGAVLLIVLFVLQTIASRVSRASSNSLAYHESFLPFGLGGGNSEEEEAQTLEQRRKQVDEALVKLQEADIGIINRMDQTRMDMTTLHGSILAIRTDVEAIRQKMITTDMDKKEYHLNASSKLTELDRKLDDLYKSLDQSRTVEADLMKQIQDITARIGNNEAKIDNYVQLMKTSSDYSASAFLKDIQMLQKENSEMQKFREAAKKQLERLHKTTWGTMLPTDWAGTTNIAGVESYVDKKIDDASRIDTLENRLQDIQHLTKKLKDSSVPMEDMTRLQTKLDQLGADINTYQQL